MINMLLGLLQIVRIPDGQFGELISQIFLICAASKHDVYCLILSNEGSEFIIWISICLLAPYH